MFEAGRGRGCSNLADEWWVCVLKTFVWCMHRDVRDEKWFLIKILHVGGPIIPVARI